ncbi:hypothetical protein Golomagni_07536 [Golovinomyces magnicellulatus]|nr:hypothetical protein Golomagni_07536 [Golovinomyces magnicellulatus]
MGPSLPPMDEPEEIDASAATPSSPYSTNRALIQDLTLPSVPDFDIPPSPPGSPSPATNKKFQQFIDLKKKGTHFNAKLESSTATRNPALMDKLLGFVDVTDTNQYQTTLSPGLWDPTAFPDWAYRNRLRRATDKVAKEREAERSSGSRNTVEFVGAVGSGIAGSSSARGQKRRAE